ncbi:phosphodiesterase [Gordonia sp. 852002-51296_SCH5728562-b]|nr:phosphodiesterase [Gordonia sp. 852002-51296_SCH5728562-b]
MTGTGATGTGELTELPPSRWSAYPDTLADVMPWIGRCLGVDPVSGDEPGASERTRLPELDAASVVLLLVDGLGERQLAAHAHLAPTLTGLGGTVLRAGFPSTTATSITSLMRGEPASGHGIIGYSFVPDDAARSHGPARTLNMLRWTLDSADGPSAYDVYPPTTLCSGEGVIGALERSGIRVFQVMPGEFKDTGFTTVASGTAGRHLPAKAPAEIRAGITTALTRTLPRSHRPRVVYAYLADLDTAGHIYGPGSDPWCDALRTVDSLVADILADLPSDARLVVTGDHGMLRAGKTIDLDAEPALSSGVARVAGEARVRQVYAIDGAVDDVADTWRDLLGDDAHIAPREQVLAEHWYGPRATDHAAARIGDLVVVAKDRTVLTRPAAEPGESRMLGHHGGWTADELLVPLLIGNDSANHSSSAGSPSTLHSPGSSAKTDVGTHGS